MSNLLQRAYWTAFLAAHLPGQVRYPYASPQHIARDRDRHLHAMVRYAYRWVPYYRETLDRLGLQPGDIRTFDDLRRLPLISVSDLQQRPEAFRSTQFREEDLLALSSSGSTGSPHIVWHDCGSIYLQAAHGERSRVPMQRLVGKGVRYRSASIDGLPGDTEHVQAAMRANALWPHRATLHLDLIEDDQPLDDLAATVERLRPDILRGFGSTLGDLYTHLDAQGVAFFRPRLIRYAVDAMSPSVRDLLTTKYGIVVSSVYQAAEAFKLGWECEAHAGYHINADWYPVRLVDEAGKDVAVGETGEVVMSNLTNRGTVLLNYRMGDLAERVDAPCPCGRNLPRIGWVEGRTVDALMAPDGRRVPWWPVTRALRAEPGVWQFQAVQEARDRLTVRVQAAPQCDRAAVTSAVRRTVAERMGPEVVVSVDFVDQLEHTARGKLRHVINRMPPGA